MTTRKVAPITPQEIELNNGKEIPDAVIECFNAEIERNYYKGSFSTGRSIVMRNRIEELIVRALPGQKFDVDWLNIESLYDEAGWKVTYSRPLNEDFEPFFTFTRK